MLPEHITQLLSAYVDGELNTRERKHVTRILRKSSEARQLLHKLKQDSMILRNLPRKKTQLDLTESAMGTISLRGIQLPKIEPSPLLPPPVAAPPKRRRSVGFMAAVAIVVLFVIGLGSYLFFSTVFRKGNVVRTSDAEATPTPENGANPGPSALDFPDRPPPAIAVLHEADALAAPTKGANPRKDDRAGLGVIRPPQFVTVQPRLASILAFRDLERDAPGQQLVQELKKDGASRLDLFCQTDTVAALDQLQEVLKARNVNLRRDAYSQARIKQRMPTNFAIYCEDLTPDELVAVFQQLARDDKKAAHFDKLTVNPVTTAELATVLGGQPSFYQQPARTGPLGVDISQDVSARTATQIVQNLGGPPDGQEHQAVAVPYLPKPGYSREVRYIVENRKGWRPGAVQVLLVLWNP